MGTLNDLAKEINKTSTEHGFWPEGGRNMGEMLMLATSELAEALEEHRSGRPAVWYKHSADCAVSEPTEVIPSPPWCSCTPKPEGIAVELADCIIRCLDTLQSLDVDIDDVVRIKMRYNDSREHRHGRKY